MLDGMVVTTGRANNDMMETPIRGTSILEEGEMVSGKRRRGRDCLLRIYPLIVDHRME